MYKSVLFVCATFLSSLYSFANEILIPENITVISINGEEQGFNLFNRQTKFAINVGANVMQVRYEELFEDIENDDHVTIKSKPFMIAFEVKGNTSLKLIVPRMLDETVARKFAKNPNVTIETTTGEQLLTKQNKMVDLIAKEQIKALEQNTTTTLSKKQHSESIQQTDATMALDMLNYWWQQANKEQRAIFLKRIQQ
ncbi:DUF2057 family protein [Thalassotalea marina]|uniref:DUF2057 domain-containing protein n=1 Tax=Thalassotalea marina TaxID=1673741 RepID=A0A919BK71_9GAMM|nr:DUF2057 family protein [Thalassotalea marina]GHF93081.1 hypothetical protein GCM10017161_21650 [Thalassotalea marina]